ncbi:unnamed protein product [Peronospora belbahrii]|uniref:RRM domain-containing protein n=1 Tax=Peronospora belbahrii TaxID=622444 RepID=A0AAU9KVY6_9STRA|nr:unnamed protein product [Peronospora belbahrii]
MDLYADLPLAKGAKMSSALDADGKPKASLPSTSSVWAGTPLMVPQAAKHKINNVQSMVASTVINSTSTPPNAFAEARVKRPIRPSMSLSFHPTSVAKRMSAAATQVFQEKEKDEKVRSTGTGLGYVAATEVKVKLLQQQERQQQQYEKEKDDRDVGAGTTGGHFFQATYRDEYQPARPNSYEVYCKERKEKKKLEQVKRELSRRQKEQEREGKLEREKLAKDLAEGRTPAMDLPAPAGRGRGMTMPAWMRKKIEENAASQPESERDVEQARELKGAKADLIDGQFEDAAESRGSPRFSTKGIGFSSSVRSTSLAISDKDSRVITTKSNFQPCGSRIGGGNYDSSDRRFTKERYHSNAPMKDEFGREIRHDVKRGSEDQSSVKHGERRKSLKSYKSHDSRLCEGTESRAFSEKRRRTNGWDSKSPQKTLLTSRVILLLNMVGPGEVDDELQDEVKGECSDKYGPVAKCVIYEVIERVSPEEAVRIFVQFTNPGDATKALTGLHGRFFGGRKVKAEYYDESKFERMDLKSQ